MHELPLSKDLSCHSTSVITNVTSCPAYGLNDALVLSISMFILRPQCDGHLSFCVGKSLLSLGHRGQLVPDVPALNGGSEVVPFLGLHHSLHQLLFPLRNGRHFQTLGDFTLRELTQRSENSRQSAGMLRELTQLL